MIRAPIAILIPTLALASLLAACAQSPVSPSANASAPTVATGVETAEVKAARHALFVNDVRHGQCDKIAPALASGLPINGFDTLDQTPLLAAVSQNQLDCARQLVDAGADVNLADQAGWTPLIHAAYFGSNVELLNLLLDHGAKVDAQNQRGLTALYIASAAGHEPQVQLLIAHGADPKIATQSGYTPVRVAQLRGLSRIVDLLQGKPLPAAGPATSTH